MHFREAQSKRYLSKSNSNVPIFIHELHKAQAET